MDKTTTEQVALTVAKKTTPYRDEKGVRILKYKRFQEGEDYDQSDNKDMIALTNASLLNLRQYRDDIIQGRPRKYETVESFYDIAEAYFQYIQDANVDQIRLIPDIEGLCSYMGISRDTLNVWEGTRDPRYSDAIKTVKNTIAFFKKQLALRNKIPQLVFATDFNNNHGYTQKQEVVLTPNNPLGSDSDPATMAQKYRDALPGATE